MKKQILTKEAKKALNEITDIFGREIYNNIIGRPITQDDTKRCLNQATEILEGLKKHNTIFEHFAVKVKPIQNSCKIEIQLTVSDSCLRTVNDKNIWRDLEDRLLNVTK